MKIRHEDILQVAKILGNRLSEYHPDGIEIPHDFYWDIKGEERYNLHQEPKEFMVGQLTEDWEMLKNTPSWGDRPLGYCFKCLAKVLDALGEEIVG
ncbi:MAG: hypothetical protein AAGF23_16495 [Acidobacteriota bacterium]